MARPTKYNDELAEALCVHLRYGASIRIAAEAEGVDRSTVERWLTRHPEFCTMVERAKGYAVTQNLRNMNLAANRGSVQAAAWLLERLAPVEFAEPPKRHEISGTDGGPVVVAFELRRVARGNTDDDHTSG